MKRVQCIGGDSGKTEMQDISLAAAVAISALLACGNGME